MGVSLRGRLIAIGVADGPLRDTLRRTLEREGGRVSSHSTGSSLLGFLRDEKPDGLILDADLPDPAGRDLVAEVKRLQPDLSIVLVSARVLPREAPSFRRLPVLPVPFRKPQLLALLQQVLPRRRDQT